MAAYNFDDKQRGGYLSLLLTLLPHGLRVVRHPPRDCINSSSSSLFLLPPTFPRLHLTLASVCSAPLPLASHPSVSSRRSISSSSLFPSSVDVVPLQKHNFRRQTKRVGVAYNEARSFVSSAAPFSCCPSFASRAQRCPTPLKSKLVADDPEVP